MSLVIRHSPNEGVLRSTDDLPGMLLIARLPPEPVSFAIDSSVEFDVPERSLRARLDADLSGVDWVGIEEVVEGLADEKTASVLWTAAMTTIKNALDVSLSRFRIDEFEAYWLFVRGVAQALAEAGYVPGDG